MYCFIHLDKNDRYKIIQESYLSCYCYFVTHVIVIGRHLLLCMVKHGDCITVDSWILSCNKNDHKTRTFFSWMFPLSNHIFKRSCQTIIDIHVCSLVLQLIVSYQEKKTIWKLWQLKAKKTHFRNSYVNQKTQSSEISL